jgi:two-component system, NarL family, invasion response regulator UvrY
MVRVLTVDDQPVFREAARELVGMMPGFEMVGESADGESAVELAREAHPDMVIIDQRMTGIDGIETARRMSALDPTAVILLVSSADVQPLAAEAEASGVAAVLRKQKLTPRLLRGLWLAHRRR